VHRTTENYFVLTEAVPGFAVLDGRQSLNHEEFLRCIAVNILLKAIKYNKVKCISVCCAI